MADDNSNILPGFIAAPSSSDDSSNILPGFQAAPSAPSGSKKAADTSYWGALKYGANEAVAGLANTDAALGKLPIVGPYYSTGEKANNNNQLPLDTSNYDPAGSHFQITDPSTYRYAPRTAVEATVGNAPTIVGGAALGPVGAAVGYGAQSFGNNVQTVAKNNNDAIPTPADFAQGAAAAGVGAGLAAAIPGVGGTVARSVASPVLKPIVTLGANAVTDAGLGGAMSAAQQAGTSIGTQNGLSVNPNDVANAAALGAGMGTIAHVPDAVQSVKMAKFQADPQNTAALQQRIAATGADTSTPKGAYTAMDATQTSLQKDLGAITSSDGYQPTQNGPIYQAKPVIDDLQPYDKGFVNDTINQVKSGQTLSDNQRAQFADTVGGSQEGDMLNSLVAQHDLYNQLSGMGVMNNKAQTFGGGFQASKMYRYTNPTNIARDLVSGGHGGGLLPALTGLGVDAAIAGPILLKAGAAGAPIAGGAMLSTRLGLNAADALTGNRNTLGNFMTHAGTGEAPVPSSAPAYTPQSQMDVLAQQANAQQAIRAQQMNQAFAARNAPDPMSVQRQQEFAQAQSQLPPQISNVAKARQIAQMWQQQAAAQKAATPPQGYSMSDANAAIQQAYAARAAQSQAALAQNAQQRGLASAIDSPTPVTPAETPQAQPKFSSASPLPPPISENSAPPIQPGSIRDRARAAAQKSKPTFSSAYEETPEGFYHQGDFIPWSKDGTINRPRYAASAIEKREAVDNQVIQGITKAADPKTVEALQDNWHAIKNSRNQSDARGFVNKTIAASAKSDRPLLDGLFNDKFFSAWRKAVPDSK